MPQQYMEIVSYATITAAGGTAKASNNVYNFYRASTVLPVVKSNIEAAFQAAIMAKVLLAMQQDYAQSRNTVRFVDDATDAPVSFTEAGVGAIATARGPDFQAVTLQLKTGLRGRTFKGSKHYSPIAEADTDGDVLTSGAATRFNTLGTAIVTGFTDSDGNVWIPTILSRKPPAQYVTNPTTVVATVITQALLNKSLGTMRRRKIRTVN